MFTKEELIVLQNVILRCDIKGGDAVVIASLLTKIENLLKEEKK